METMKSFELAWSVVCHKIVNPETDIELEGLLDKEILEKFIEKIWQDVILVLWGDGTMLSAIRENYEKNLPFMWFNFGTKWFLLNDRDCFHKRDFSPRDYPLLEVQNNWEYIWVAFNDLNIYPTSGNLLQLETLVHDSVRMWFRWDGIIISTPAWSTGHSKWYWAPTLEHSSKNLIITSKWNTIPDSPKTVRSSSTIAIKNTWRLFDIWVNLDGQVALKTSIWEEISLLVHESHHKVQLLIASDYIENWDNKVLQQLAS